MYGWNAGFVRWYGVGLGQSQRICLGSCVATTTTVASIHTSFPLTQKTKPIELAFLLLLLSKAIATFIYFEFFFSHLFHGCVLPSNQSAHSKPVPGGPVPIFYVRST